jgi:hypothetical protein
MKACELVIIQIISYDQLVADYEKLCYDFFWSTRPYIHDFCVGLWM